MRALAAIAAALVAASSFAGMAQGGMQGSPSGTANALPLAGGAMTGDLTSTSNIEVTGAGRVGIGTSSPGEKLHLVDGQLLFQGFAMETAIQFQYVGAVGSVTNPLFSMGRITAAPTGYPMWRLMFSGTGVTEYPLFMVEGGSGTIATNGQTVRGSRYESFSVFGAEHPEFRANAYGPGGGGFALEMGPGGHSLAAGKAVCTGSNTITLTIDEGHRFAGNGSAITIGLPAGSTDTARIPPDDYTAATVPDANTVTISTTCTNGASQGVVYVSGPTDTILYRYAEGLLAPSSGTNLFTPSDIAQCFGTSNCNTYLIADTGSDDLVLNLGPEFDTFRINGAAIDIDADFVDTISSSVSSGDAIEATAGGYIKAQKTFAGAPNAEDCDNDSEYGRIAIDTANERLYICNGATRGWDYTALTD